MTKANATIKLICSQFISKVFGVTSVPKGGVTKYASVEPKAAETG